MKDEIDCELCEHFKEEVNIKSGVGNVSIPHKEHYCTAGKVMHWAGGKWLPPRVDECENYNPKD